MYLSRRDCRNSYLWVALVLFALVFKSSHACAFAAMPEPGGASAPSYSHLHASDVRLAQADIPSPSAGHRHEGCPEPGADPVCGFHCADGEQAKSALTEFPAEAPLHFQPYGMASPAEQEQWLPTGRLAGHGSPAPPSRSLTILYRVFTI